MNNMSLRGGIQSEKRWEASRICLVFFIFIPLVYPQDSVTPSLKTIEEEKIREELQMGAIHEMNDERKRKCVECGKALGFFEGYCHPTLGMKYLTCWECFERVELSVQRWGQFVLWNSFNPEAPDPTFLDTFPFPREETQDVQKKPRHQKHFRFLL